MNTIKIIIALAVHCNWDLHQYDVKNAFLNGDLDETIFMNLPPEYEAKYGILYVN